MAKKSAVDKLLDTHQELVHSENMKVISHVQRADRSDDEWYINTIMLENIDTPFKYKRKKQYKSLTNQYVNITYYPDNETVAGFDIEIMKIVRLKTS
ncbi:MAG: hypothetical protein COB35_01245 [Gammaproteobacteria bacterium]|nr:MAG: hypothetical protein COB35_01245 [Gammaproteobacteria bacterium]